MAASRVTGLIVASAALVAGISHLVMVTGVALVFAPILGLLSILEICGALVVFSTARMPSPRAIAAAALSPLLALCLLVVISTLAGDTAVASSFATIPMAIATAFELAIVAVLHFSSRIVSGHA